MNKTKMKHGNQAFGIVIDDDETTPQPPFDKGGVNVCDREEERWLDMQYRENDLKERNHATAEAWGFVLVCLLIAFLAWVIVSISN